MASITLTKPIKIDGEEIKKIDLKLDDLSGKEVLKIDKELKAEGIDTAFEGMYSQESLVRFVSKSSGILVEDLEQLSARDFIKVTFKVRDFLFGVLEEKESSVTSEESTSN